MKAFVVYPWKGFSGTECPSYCESINCYNYSWKMTLVMMAFIPLIAGVISFLVKVSLPVSFVNYIYRHLTGVTNPFSGRKLFAAFSFYTHNVNYSLVTLLHLATCLCKL